MHNILTVAKKEFRDILRDRKTLITTFLIPILIMPLMFSFIFSSIGDMAPSADNKYKIILDSDSVALNEMFASDVLFEVIDSSGDLAAEKAYDGEVLLYVKVDDGFENMIQNNETPTIELYYDTTSQKAETAVQIVQSMLTSYQTNYVTSLLQENGLPDQALQPFRYLTHAKDEETDGMSTMLLGMLVPMMIIGYAATGIVPIATDLGAGEKERGTLEPLLSTSVSRNSIFIGKLIVSATFGIITSVLSATGILLSTRFGLSSSMEISVSIPTTDIVIILVLAVLYSIFISAVLLAVSTYARSLKEANTYLSPFILIPVLVSVMTMYMEISSISTTLMHVPVLNVVLVIREILYNQLNYTHLYITLAWSVGYIIIAMLVSRWLYSREDVIFRT